jgi:hypothetical protein
MAEPLTETQSWTLPDSYLEKIFRKHKKFLESQNKNIFFDWSRPVLSEVSPNVARSLHKKFSACEDGYSAAKIAALYTFWIARLKPGFGIMSTHIVVNEYLGLAIGFAIIRERIGIDIILSPDELLDMFDTLRYHTTSPHMLMHMYGMWIEREKLRTFRK